MANLAPSAYKQITGTEADSMLEPELITEEHKSRLKILIPYAQSNDERGPGQR